MKILFQPIIIFLVLCVFISCGKSKEETGKVNLENQESVVLSKLPKIGKLSSKAKEKIDGWVEFENFENGFQRMYDGGDNLTEAEALVNLEKEIFASTFPTEFNIPPIKTRFLVLRTFLLQLKAAAVENAPSNEIQEYKIKVVESYNSLLGQFNEALTESIADEFLMGE